MTSSREHSKLLLEKQKIPPNSKTTSNRFTSIKDLKEQPKKPPR